jgi:cyclase
MLRIRIIPLLLLKGNGFYKGVKFKNHKYIGDPLNVIKIFNDKEVDEIIILDVSASLEQRGPHFELLAELASEAFMPLAYGGGVKTIDDMKRLFHLGVEKIVLNTAALAHPELISAAADIFGSQSVIVALDVKKNFLRDYRVYAYSGTQKTDYHPLAWVKTVAALGAGEILLNMIDKDGTLSGYDLKLAEDLAKAVAVPVILAGGAASLADFKKAVEVGVSAVAAGAMFVFYGAHKGVLIQYPGEQEVLDAFTKKQEVI